MIVPNDERTMRRKLAMVFIKGKIIKGGIKFVLAIGMGIVLTGCGLMPQEEAILAPPLIVPEQISYRTVEPTRGYIEDAVTGVAYFVPVKQYQYFFENNGGRFKEFHVKNGDKVSKGDKLATMLTTGLDNQITKQSLYVDTLEKTYTYMLRVQEIELADAQKALKALQNNGGSTSDIELKSIQIERMKLDGNYQKAIKKNELEQAKISLNELQAQMENSVLVSDIDGVVTFVSDTKEGDYLDTYRTLVTVSDPNLLQLEYSGLQANQMNLGMELEVTYAEEKYKGEVVFVPSMAPMDDYEAFKNRVRIDIELMPEGVVAGHFADIKLIYASDEDALIVPRKAVKKYNGKDIVYTLADGFRVENYVEIGIAGITEVQILQGIDEGVQIIIE